MKIRTHVLKTDPEVFDAVKSGKKKFEIRLNDRDFKLNDVLVLKKTRHTGAEMKAGAELAYLDEHVSLVTHILHGPVYGLQEGWVIMSITNSPVHPFGSRRFA